jgi:hypothetical protein
MVSQKPSGDFHSHDENCGLFNYQRSWLSHLHWQFEYLRVFKRVYIPYFSGGHVT